MNIVPQYLADVFYLPSSEWSKKSYKPWIIAEGRTITDKARKGQKRRAREKAGDKVTWREEQK